MVFSAKACFKVVVKSVKNGEAIVCLVNPYYSVLPYLRILIISLITKDKVSTGGNIYVAYRGIAYKIFYYIKMKWCLSVCLSVTQFTQSSQRAEL